MDSVFGLSLKARDAKKDKKRKRQKSNKGKLTRRKIELAKFTDGHKEQMEDARTGKTYGADVALTQATKIAKAKHIATKQNPKGTAPENMRCPYHHPMFCAIMGHNAASNKSCFAKHKTIDKLKVILATIKRLQIEVELAVQADGMSFCCTGSTNEECSQFLIHRD